MEFWAILTHVKLDTPPSLVDVMCPCQNPLTDVHQLVVYISHKSMIPHLQLGVIEVLELLQDQPHLKVDVRLRRLETTECGLVGLVHLTKRVWHAVGDRWLAAVFLLLYCSLCGVRWPRGRMCGRGELQPPDRILGFDPISPRRVDDVALELLGRLVVRDLHEIFCGELEALE